MQHRRVGRPRRVAHVAVPAPARAAHAERLAVLGDIGKDVELRDAVEAELLAVVVELELAEAPGEGDMVGG